MRATRAYGVVAIALTLVIASRAVAAEKIATGSINSPSPLSWPFYIALAKGMFTAKGLALDVSYTNSAPNLLQQTSAGSFDFAMSTGLVDPIRAIAKGGPVSLVLVEVTAAPYELMGKAALKNLAGLKGRNIAVGGLNDITNIYLDRMVAPSGLKRGDFDMQFFGSTPARFAALQAGSVDAAMLGPPANYYAASAGYISLGFVKDYAGDLPFSGSAVNTAWAKTHADDVRAIVATYDEATKWFDDEKNRDEAIAIMVAASKGKPDDIAKSYDFLRKGDYFDRSGTISKAKLANLVHAMHQLGDLDDEPPPEKLVLSGVTKLVE
ncbi:MAG TPA: ABC transporter substrate-binding protein [Stellaceae bacterium]|jgi:ABC-type nitrate/sulfonate/bicarbonate transport system substrate-binding protein|nr:ABC transporter substrate-binding protein [Stellaceae bacterium]